MTLFQDLIKEDPKKRDELQKQLLLRIQKQSRRKTIAYLANFSNSPHNMINSEDKSAVDMLIDSLSPQTKSIDFILNSPGGFAEDTEMIVTILRNKFDKIRFIIPHSAMSAATMLALSGDKILMFSSSQLGPIDPQVKGPTSGPAQSIIDGFDEIKKEVEKSKRLNGAYVPLLNKMDVATIKFCENSIKYGKTNVKKWLRDYMFKDLSALKKRKIAEKIGNYFSSQRRHLTHRKPIFREQAIAQGLVIEQIEKDRKFAQMIKEYYCRWELLFNTPTPVTKIFQSESEFIVRNAPVVMLENPVRIPRSPQRNKK